VSALSAAEHGVAAATDRVVVACSMKSGSTYVAQVLARYLDADARNEDLALYWPAEQNLSRGLCESLGSRSFVLQMHLRPHAPNLALLSEFNVTLLLQWRNLGDVLISFDDHVRQFSELQPICYIHDRAAYLALDEQARYAFLIRNALPWYLAFYLSWRRLHARFGSYERMVADPAEFFREALMHLGLAVDEARLADALWVRGSDRFNVGRVGRSAERFAPDTKRLLERTVLEYVPTDELDVLLWELPWEVPALAPRSAFDGAIVGVAGDDRRYFVSRGVRRWISSPAWIASRWKLRDQPQRIVTPEEFATLDDGANALA
jgi:hypothetical protein